MGRFRVRSKTAKKGFRWRRGQSSSDNAVKTKHRQRAAANRLDVTNEDFNDNTVFKSASENLPSRLTESALMQHDALVTDTRPDDQEELGSQAGSAATFASVWSGCTHSSFTHLLASFDPKKLHHKHMLAVLSAVTEVISKEKREPSSSAYLAGLLAALQSMETNEGMAATAALIAMVIKTVPDELLQLKLGDVGQTLVEILARNSSIGNASSSSVVRSIIQCLSVVLRKQSPSGWQSVSTRHIFNTLLTFTISSKPKVRKCAHRAVTNIITAHNEKDDDDMEENNNEDADINVVASQEAAKFCLQHLKLVDQPQAVLHTLTLLQTILTYLTKSTLKSVCEQILGLMRTRLHPHIKLCGLRSLFALFASRPSSSRLPADLNAKLFVALTSDHMPAFDDAKVAFPWLAVQQECLVNLSCNDRQIALKQLPTFFDILCSKALVSGNRGVIDAAAVALKAVLTDCVKPYVDSLTEDKSLKDNGPVLRAIDKLKPCLGYQYHSAWNQVLQVWSVLIEVLGPVLLTSASVLHSLLIPLAHLRDQEGSTRDSIDFVVGKACRILGPETLLRHIELKLTDMSDQNFNRAWLLPVLRSNIRLHASLKYFNEHLVSMANKCLLLSDECSKKDDIVGQKTFAITEMQLWSLFPGFCLMPTDLDYFPKMAKTVGMRLKERKELRMDIMAGLRNLSKFAKEKKEGFDSVAKFAKNFLPILCNMYTMKPEPQETDHRSAALETIQVYLELAPKSLIESMHSSALELYSKETDGFTRDSTLDILRVLMPYQQDEKYIAELFEVVVANLKKGQEVNENKKKNYKFLETLCTHSHSNRILKEFVENHLEELKSVLLSSLSSSKASSQASRLRCLAALINGHLEEEESALMFMNKVLPECILCVRATNARARANAFAIIVMMGERRVQLSETKEAEMAALADYTHTIMAGLAGSPMMITCTVLTLARVLYAFNDLLVDESVEKHMLHNIALLMTSSAREIVSACLSFIKVFITVWPTVKVAKLLPQLVRAISAMTDDVKRHFRLKTHYLLDKLVRKFGHELVNSLVPKNDVILAKRINNIRKAHNRVANKTTNDANTHDNEQDDGAADMDDLMPRKVVTMEEILGDSDDDDEPGLHVDQVSGSNSRDKTRKRKLTTTIREGDDDIVDFMDASAAQKVGTFVDKSKRGEEGVKKKRNGGFEINEDGKLVIEEDEDEEKPLSKKNKELMMDEPEEEAEENLEDAMRRMGLKRQRGASSRGSYKSGGTGIHRPLSAKRSVATDLGSEYKSVKSGGDVKRKGMPDPYAYLPFNRSGLNKRKRAKNEGQFKSIVGATKKAVNSSKRKKVKRLSDKRTSSLHN